ncbi:hypothetical protein BaRGS_00025470 [Batillaria attramentaria]|uniref:Low-density lipoprotein receptor domain class A n=1 Tax=Batillaria attramentaria TaxID=370345 RepID=A0ABD0K8B9_9CAEN
MGNGNGIFFFSQSCDSSFQVGRPRLFGSLSPAVCSDQVPARVSVGGWTMAYYPGQEHVISKYRNSASCSALVTSTNRELVLSFDCDKELSANVLCESAADLPSDTNAGLPKLLQRRSFRNQTMSGRKLVTCPKGHVTREFLSCDPSSRCWADDFTSCKAPLTPLPPSFRCLDLTQAVPYTLVCDGRSDCSDNSDEDFCTMPSCETQASCLNKQVGNSMNKSLLI